MEVRIIKSAITVYQMEELNDNDRHLIEQAIEATNNSYVPYSHFHVGSAVSSSGNSHRSAQCKRTADRPCDSMWQLQAGTGGNGV